MEGKKNEVVKENGSSIVRGRSVSKFRGNGTDKSQHKGGNRGLRQEKHLRCNQDGDSNRQNPN